jgi:hypothetical protein
MSQLVVYLQWKMSLANANAMFIRDVSMRYVAMECVEMNCGRDGF